jgi:hypothetical protein
LIKLDTPRNTDRPNVLQVDLPSGVHHFRLPSMLKVSKMLKGAGSKHLAALMVIGKMIDSGNSAGALAMLQSSGTEGLSVMGALVGISWFHENLELETPRNDSDFLAYGEDVYEELHEEGYDTIKLLLIAGYLTKNIAESLKFDGEVAEKLGFTSTVQDPKN